MINKYNVLKKYSHVLFFFLILIKKLKDHIVLIEKGGKKRIMGEPKRGENN